MLNPANNWNEEFFFQRDRSAKKTSNNWRNFLVIRKKSDHDFVQTSFYDEYPKIARHRNPSSCEWRTDPLMLASFRSCSNYNLPIINSVLHYSREEKHTL